MRRQAPVLPRSGPLVSWSDSGNGLHGPPCLQSSRNVPLQGRQHAPFHRAAPFPVPPASPKGPGSMEAFTCSSGPSLSSPPYLRAFPMTIQAAHQLVSREGGWALLLLGGSWLRSDSAGGRGPWAPFSAEEMASQGVAGAAEWGRRPGAPRPARVCPILAHGWAPP